MDINSKVRSIYISRASICEKCQKPDCRVKQDNGCKSCGLRVLKVLWWQCPEGKFGSVSVKDL